MLDHSKDFKEQNKERNKDKIYKTIYTFLVSLYFMPVLLYEYKIWAPTRTHSLFKNESLRTEDCTRQDCLWNEDTRKDLQIFSINDKNLKYLEYSQYLDRMEDAKLFHILYRPLGRRDVGRLKVWWKDLLWKRKRKYAYSMKLKKNQKGVFFFRRKKERVMNYKVKWIWEKLIRFAT